MWRKVSSLREQYSDKDHFINYPYIKSFDDVVLTFTICFRRMSYHYFATNFLDLRWHCLRRLPSGLAHVLFVFLSSTTPCLCSNTCSTSRPSFRGNAKGAGTYSGARDAAVVCCGKSLNEIWMDGNTSCTSSGSALKFGKEKKCLRTSDDPDSKPQFCMNSVAPRQAWGPEIIPRIKRSTWFFATGTLLNKQEHYCSASPSLGFPLPPPIVC